MFYLSSSLLDMMLLSVYEGRRKGGNWGMESHIQRINLFSFFIAAAVFFTPAVDGHRYVSTPQAQSYRQGVSSAPSAAFSIQPGRKALDQIPSVKTTGSIRRTIISYDYHDGYYPPPPLGGYQLYSYSSPSPEGYSSPSPEGGSSPPPETYSSPPAALPPESDSAPTPEFILPHAPPPPPPESDSSPSPSPTPEDNVPPLLPRHGSYSPAPSPRPKPSADTVASGSPSKKGKKMAIIGAVIGSLVFVVIVGALVWKYKSRPANEDAMQSAAHSATTTPQSQFTQQSPNEGRVLLPGLSPTTNGSVNKSASHAAVYAPTSGVKTKERVPARA